METAQTTMQEVQELIKRVRMDPRANNKPVLGVNIQALQTAKNGGYPRHMYHERLEAIQVLSSDEELAVATKGYVSHYIAHAYPKWKFRRNMDDKFAGYYVAVNDGKNQMFVPNPYGANVEGVSVNDAAAEVALMKKKTPASAGPWFDKVTDIEALPDAPEENPEVTQARLEGQIAELKSQLENRKSSASSKG
jgi:hypothetical protein